MNRVIKNQLYALTFLCSVSSGAQAVRTTINFDVDANGDAISAPDLFSAATPLTTQYAAKNVTFTALERNSITSDVPHNGVLKTQTRNVLEPSSTGMGAILDEGSEFGRSAPSGDNFLAFNGATDFGTHFWRIDFADPIGYFQIDYFNGQPPYSGRDDLLFEAFDSNDQFLGRQYDHYLSPSSNRMAFKSLTDIAYVNIGHELSPYYSSFLVATLLTATPQSTPWALAYDDLVFGEFSDAGNGVLQIGPSAVIPLPASAWLFISGLLAFCGLRKKQQ